MSSGRWLVQFTWASDHRPTVSHQSVTLPITQPSSFLLGHPSTCLAAWSLFFLFVLAGMTHIVPPSTFPQQNCPVPHVPFCLLDIWHDLQYDPVLCYPQEPRDGLESACTPEQESPPLKIVGYFLGVLFFFVFLDIFCGGVGVFCFVLFFWCVVFVCWFFFFFATNLSIHSAFPNKKVIPCLSF